jgi:hypothetical protein
MTQKEAVVEQVLLEMPTFKRHVDNAILVLSNQQLENIKANIFNGIINGVIEYGKNPNNHAEARSYARSMVMNHLKKAKELNGGHTYSSNTAGPSPSSPKTVRVKAAIAPKGVNPELLTEELKEFVKTLI